MSGNSGVEHLIKIAKGATKAGDLHMTAIAALGEAGGASARAYLISVIDGATKAGELHLNAITALGRASRCD